jgi:hypothetical protein
MNITGGSQMTEKLREGNVSIEVIPTAQQSQHLVISQAKDIGISKKTSSLHISDPMQSSIAAMVTNKKETRRDKYLTELLEKTVGSKTNLLHKHYMNDLAAMPIKD